MRQSPFPNAIPRWFGTLSLIVLISLLAGCQTLPAQPVVTLDDIVQMSKEGKSANEIIATLEQRRVQAYFSGSQLAKLKEQGVPDAVLDYLLNAYASNLRYQSRMDADPYWWHHPFYYRPYRVIVVEHPRK